MVWLAIWLGCIEIEIWLSWAGNLVGLYNWFCCILDWVGYLVGLDWIG